MPIAAPTWTPLVLGALLAALRLSGIVLAVQVDAPAGPVQPHAGCTSGTAAFCDLRIYQVMVEAFVDGDPTRNYNAGYGTSHHKGDLRGIINSLDYMKSLGMNAIWLTPVFDSHAGEPREGGGINLKLDATGYWTRDYFEIDPKFGSLTDAQELVATAHDKGMYVFFDGVFGHHKGNLIPSPTGKLPVNSSPGFADYSSPATLAFYKEVATYWIEQLGIDGWRLDQSYQVPPSAWREIRAAVENASAQRALAGEEWGTLGYMVAEDWSDAGTIANRTFGSDANPILHSAFDFPVRYAIVGVVNGEESGLTGRPASVINQSWAYGAHDNVYASHALPNLMLGNHDLVRFGDLLQRVDLAEPNQPEYWARHRLAFTFQAAYSGPITRYYGEEIGDEVPNYADQVTSNCANLGLCDDHVARTSAKILGVTVTDAQLSANQRALIEFHRDLMALREAYPALSHGARQHLYSDDDLFADLKSLGEQEIVFAMNVGDQSQNLRLNPSLFDETPLYAWDLLAGERIDLAQGYLDFTLAPLSARYLLLIGPSIFTGDFDQDGDVDSYDYTIWQSAYATARADANNDGATDTADYVIWRSHLGAGLSGESTAATQAPEPSAILHFAVSLLVSAHRRRCPLW